MPRDVWAPPAPYALAVTEPPAGVASCIGNQSLEQTPPYYRSRRHQAPVSEDLSCVWEEALNARVPSAQHWQGWLPDPVDAGELGVTPTGRVTT